MRNLILFVLTALAAVYASSEIRDEFVAFQHKFGKFYTAEEFPMRLANFIENRRIAEEHQRANPQAQFGVTKFSDLSAEEFAKYYLMPKQLHADIKERLSSVPEATIEYVDDIPTEYDWRSKGAVTPVYNQAQCGSCWAFSATETIESYAFLAKGSNLENYAMQQIVDCDTTAYGCNGGWTYAAYNYIKSVAGQDSLSSYPYTAQNGQCAYNPSNVEVKLDSWQYITQDDDEQKMQQWAYQNGPLSICVDAASWQTYQGGVIQNCGQQIDHCVQLTGFSTQSGVEAWNVRNSWGADWGNNGYLYVARGNNVCAIGNVVTAVTATQV